MLPSDIKLPSRFGVTSIERTMQRAGQRLGQLFAGIACLACVSISHAAPGTWSSEAGVLRYSATVSLLGKATPVELAFGCEVVANQCTESGSSVDWAILKTAPLKPFNFDAFDVSRINAKVENRLMQITITRKGQPDFVRTVRAAGVEPSKGFFVFHLNPNSVIVEQNPKKQPSSVPEILQALAADGATSLTISVTDSKNAKLKLDVTVPLAGKQAEFRKLLKAAR